MTAVEPATAPLECVQESECGQIRSTAAANKLLFCFHAVVWSIAYKSWVLKNSRESALVSFPWPGQITQCPPLKEKVYSGSWLTQNLLQQLVRSKGERHCGGVWLWVTSQSRSREQEDPGIRIHPSRLHTQATAQNKADLLTAHEFLDSIY